MTFRKTLSKQTISNICNLKFGNAVTKRNEKCKSGNAVIVCCDRLLLAHSANVIKLTFMVIKIFSVRLFCAPLVCCARGQLPPLPLPLVTPLSLPLTLLLLRLLSRCCSLPLLSLFFFCCFSYSRFSIVFLVILYSLFSLLSFVFLREVTSVWEWDVDRVLYTVNGQKGLWTKRP